MKTEHVLCPISFRRKLRQQLATRASWPSRDTRSQISLNSTTCHEGCRPEFTGMFILLLQFLFLFLLLSLMSSGRPVSSRIQLREHPEVYTGNYLQRLHRLKSGVCRTLPLSHPRVSPASALAEDTVGNSKRKMEWENNRLINAGTSSTPAIELMELIDLVVQEPRQSQNSDRRRNERLPEDRTLPVPLLQAALKGDWKTANSFLRKHPEFVRVPIDREYATALHNAAASKHTNFVIKLLKLMNKEDLELKTTDGCTTLFFAAQSGVVRIAMEMVKMNKDLLCIRAKQDVTPLLAAAMRGRRNMVSYLYSVTPFQEYLTSTVERLTLLLAAVSTDMYDVALKILERDPDLATAETATYGRITLKTMNVDTRSTSFAHTVYGWIALGRGDGEKTICNWQKKSISNLGKMPQVGMLSINQMSSNLVQHHMNLLIEAAKVGNVEFLNILIRSYPDLIWQVDEDGKTLLHIAILYRQENVFNLIYDIAATTNSIALSIDENDNNMLHLAGELAPSSRLKTVSGAALQMQRELLWFKIEKIVPPAYVVKKNLHGQTPRDLFTMTHEGLLKDGEKWMKDTTSSCMLVATLIATVVFVAAFTGPGGKSLDSGTSIVLESTGFLVFFISDAIAFLSSSTSILVFLSILMSRYTEKDFLRSLPMRLLLGLTALFISVVGMVVAFSATCSLIYSREQTSRVLIVIAPLTGVPVTLFVLLHYELWIDIMRSTYGSRFLFRSYKRRLFQLGEDDEWAIWQYQI